jgi:hypothetical protein
MRNLYTAILLGLSLLQNLQFAQGEIIEPIVAWVGEEAITCEDFIELYELNPQINSINNSTSYFSKLKFLNTLIAYKLWSQNKNELGVTESLAYNTAKEEIKKLFVRDALYRTNILERISLSSKEIDEGIKKQKQNLVIDCLVLEKEKEAFNFYKLLQQGFPIDTLLAARNEIKIKIESSEIEFGQYSEYIENQLYGLNVGGYSHPIQQEDGYYIFHLKNIVIKLWDGNKKNDEDIESVKKILNKRKEIEIYNNYMRSVLNGLQVNVDKKLFNKLTDELDNIYIKNIDNHKTDKEFFHLTNSEFVELENKFEQSELISSFISFPSDTLTLQNYLRSFFFNGIKFPKSNLTSVIPILDSYLREFIIKEKLYQTGIEQCLDTLNEVKKYENMWTEYYAFETAKGNMLDTVNIPLSEIEYEINRKQIFKTKQELVKLNYICYKDSASLNDILVNLEPGMCFDSLKRENEISIHNAFFSDSTSWIPLSICGEFKSEISELSPGEFLEPIKWDSLFVVLKLSDKKQIAEDTSAFVSENTVENVKDILALQKLKAQIVNATYKLAMNTSIKINYEILQSLEVTKINSFTIRYMGFGGSITGVPIYAPNYEWSGMLNTKYKYLP